MAKNPWWWPKSQADVGRLLDRIHAYNADYRLYMVRRFVVFATGCFFAFGMSWSLVMLLLIIGKDIANATKGMIALICLTGGISALLARAIDREVFDEMAEVFLGIPMSRRTKKRLKDEFGVEL
jgi:hypothetical protein